MPLQPRRDDLSGLAHRLASQPPKILLVDCFGTLLHRVVPSDHVRERVAAQLASYDDVGASASEILGLRRSLERQLGTTPDGIARDHGADELGRALFGRLTDRPPDEDDFVGRLCELEVAAEATATRRNDALVSLLEAQRPEMGIALVSDTNLTEAMMGELLDHHGLGELVDRVFVSSAMGETKRSGALYSLVLEALGAAPHEALVVGDNPRSDDEMARAAGLQSVVVSPGPWDSTKRAPARVLRRDLGRRLARIVAPTDARDVFPELSLTLWLFAERLHRSLSGRGATCAVFLAREGRYLREIYHRYLRATSVLPRDRIATEYLPVSRKSTSLPETAEVDASRRREQAQLLESLVLPLVTGGELDLVDVGWKGTVQDNLASLLGSRAAVTGHYLGIASRQPVADKHGLVFTNQPARSPYYQVFSHFKAAYEVFLSAPTGSVAGYYRAGDGSTGVRFDENEVELRCHRELIAPLQDRWAGRVDEISALMAAHRVDDAEALTIAARHHGRMMYRPRAAELAFVEQLVHYENFGRRRLDGIGAPAGETPTARGGLRRHVAGGGWPPLRMRRAGRGWLRHPYGIYKSTALKLGRLA